MRFTRYADGFRLGSFGMRWNAGVCAPERRRHVFLLSLGNDGSGAHRLAVQVWRAGAWIEVLAAPSDTEAGR
jgi:hypothetical protein